MQLYSDEKIHAKILIKNIDMINKILNDKNKNSNGAK